MQMFVFEDVLYDYTAGMVVIAARNLERAREIAREQYEHFQNEPGWQRPTGVYGATGIEREGVLHEVFGGA